jgi:ribosomal protein S18 acetylase RimI-like enzyme
MSQFAGYDLGPRPERPRKGVDCVRIARPEDVDAIALISAKREGLDVDAIRAPIGRELGGIGNGDPWCVFVAEIDGAVVAYGRIRNLRHERNSLPTELPEGWYLNGLVVDPAFRRRGIGSALIEARLSWVRERDKYVYYVSNLVNRVSIELHASFGFEEIARGFDYPRARLAAEHGVAFRLRLRT